MIDERQVSKIIKSYPARWVTLLESAGLSAHTVSDIEVITDHLPADIPAPSAWTTVSTAVELACIAGCNIATMTEHSLYLIVRGAMCQLRFRDHPGFGIVAVFDLFIKKRFYPSDAPCRQEEIKDENLSGPIAYKTIFSMSMISDDLGCIP